MPIEFYCKSCQKRLRCPDSSAGSKARCPQCSEVNSVPLFSDPPQMSAPPGASSSPYELQPETPRSQNGSQFTPPSSPPTPSPYAAPPSPPNVPTPPISPPISPPRAPNQPPAFPSASASATPTVSPPNQFSDTPLKDAGNPYAAPMQGGMASQPADQSGLASSLGVVSIVVGSVSLIFGFCCCPIGSFGSVIALGLGIWGWIVAANQLKQTKHAPYLRHLEPPAKTALILCIIGTAISGLAVLLVGGSFLFMMISALMNPLPSNSDLPAPPFRRI